MKITNHIEAKNWLAKYGFNTFTGSSVDYCKELDYVISLFENRERTCYHEAGHAVIAHSLDFEVLQITTKIIPRFKEDTSLEYIKGYVKYWIPESREKTEQNIIINYAGVWAEAKYLTNQNNKSFIKTLKYLIKKGSPRKDFEAIDIIDSTWLSNKNKTDQASNYIITKWPEIIKVANVLINKEEISIKEFLTLV